MSNGSVMMNEMPQPLVTPPIGLRLTQAARVVSGVFDRAMEAAGGSRPAWQVLLLVRSQQWGTQSAMAEAIGITSGTLTHHLNALERQGLVRRWREDSNRRVQRTELTEAGEARFEALREVAVQHDQRLRSALSDTEVLQLAELLDKLLSGLQDTPADEPDDQPTPRRPRVPAGRPSLPSASALRHSPD